VHKSEPPRENSLAGCAPLEISYNSMDVADLLKRITEPFCIFTRERELLLATGDIERHNSLSQISRENAGLGYASISMLPFSQLKERNFEVRDEGEPILSLVPRKIEKIGIQEFIDTFPPLEPDVEMLEMNKSDEEFQQNVADVIEHEINKGEGSNFLISRRSYLRIRNMNAQVALTILRRLLINEFGFYTSFVFFDGEKFFVGASPERHITIRDGIAVMNPISGTLPMTKLNSAEDLAAFLRDKKEINELFQVTDETLKMMSKICTRGGKMQGPFLKEMGSLIHTEYTLNGETRLDIMEAFRRTMYAPTMIGSPLENAARIVYKYDRESRRYYTSVLLFLGHDENDREFLDSTITIRTLEASLEGEGFLQAGASLVRDSVPKNELEEVIAKARALVNAITKTARRDPVLPSYETPEIKELLASRNRTVSSFWLEKQEPLAASRARKALIIDNEDEFAYMLAHILRYLNFHVTIERTEQAEFDFESYELVVLGPGPGDPENASHPRIKRAHALAQALLESNRKFLAICLGHQIICARFGLKIEPLRPPLQGVQKEINLFGQTELVGFYNTFCAKADGPVAGLKISSDEDGFINALAGENFRSFQFHPESVLTPNGVSIIKKYVEELLP